MGRGRRKSEPLPKGQELGSPEVKIEGTTGTTGAFGLQEAPVFYPTEEEFENPLQYIALIRPRAETFGLCRIVPPSSWNPPFGLDTEKFTFPTKLQAIHHLQERPAACDAETFKLEYSRFLRKQGETLENWPTLDGEELDLCKLFNAVKRHGGNEKVTSENRWGEVVRMVTAGASPAYPSSSKCLSLRQLYESHLSTFEVYQTKVGAGKRWRAKAKQDSAEKSASKPKRGGRKRLSSSAVDVEASGDIKKSDSAENELCEVLRPAVDGEARSQSKRLGRRRQSISEVDLEVSRENVKSEPAAEDVSEALPSPGDGDGRPQTNSGAPRKRRKTEEKLAVPEGLGRTDQICEQCHSGAHEQLMLLCDRCDRGWHLYCLSPPLSSVPVGNWYCLECLSSESESFGFGQGQEYSFDSFRRMADRFKRKWFGYRPSTYADLEREFWRVVERGTSPVDVVYGSDLDTGVYGSGFPRDSDPIPAWSNAEAWDAGAKSPWNVNNFPKLEGSMLRLVHDNIPGVMVPWLYIGMLFSSFCWHYEDHCFYSVNYLHCGEPKSWYSVPGTAAEEFEKVMRNTFPDLFEAQPDLLFQLVTMLNPTVLRDNGVPVCMTVQEPRNFVITFPRSYHGGFNHGFNCAEAVNFAPSDWLPYGGFGVDRYRLYHKAAVLSHDELICVVAKNDKICGKSPWLQQELSRIVTKERLQREYLWSLGMVKSSKMTPSPNQDRIGAEEDAECIICRYYLHLSAVTCECRPGKAVCLQHARQLCECNADQQSLLYRFTLAELDDLITNDDQSFEDCKVGDLAAASSTNKRRLRRGQNGASSLTSPLVKKVKGRPYKHAELADTWLSQARAAGKSHLRSPVLEDLLTQVQQFLWGGHEMDQVREMVEKLNIAHKWVQDVAACAIAVDRHGHAGSGKALKVPFATVQKLVTVDPVPWVEPHLQTLKALFDSACRLEQEIEEALTSTPPLEMRVLIAVQQEAGHSPFELPGLQRLKDVVASAQDWSERVQKIFSSPTENMEARPCIDEANLEQLQALHAEGLKLPVVLGEKNLLETAMKNVEEWQLRASQLLGSSCTLQDMEEALQSSKTLSVRPPNYDLMEGRLLKAKQWIEFAGDALVQVDQRTDFALSMKICDDLLLMGRNLQVDGLHQINLLEAKLQILTWMHRASQALLDHPTVKSLEDLLSDATRLELSDHPLISQINSTLKDACSWELKSEQLFTNRGSLVEFTDLASAAEGICAKLPDLIRVSNAISDAKQWLNRASIFLKKLSGDPVEDGDCQLDLCILKTLVSDSQELSISLQEAKVLNAGLAEAELWTSKARCLEASVFVTQKSSSQIGCSLDVKSCRGETEQLRHGSVSKFEDSPNYRRLQDDLVKLQSAIDEGLCLCVKVPEIAQLQDLSSTTRLGLQTCKLVDCSPTVKEVEAHLEDATCSKLVMLPEFTLLQRMLSDTKTWLQAAASFLPGFGTKGNCTEDQLEMLITDAKGLALSVSSEARCLEDILVSHRSWRKKVQQALSGMTCLKWSELLKLQEAGKADMVHTVEEDLLDREVIGIKQWLVRLHEALAPQPSHQSATLEELLLKMRKSVEFSLEYLDTGDEKRKRDPKCVCQNIIDKSDSSLLHCDLCDDWYHPACIGVSLAHTRGQKQYTCPYCSAVSSGVPPVNKDLCSKIYATQRPRIGQLHQLVFCGQMLRCRIEEMELLEAVVDLVQTWKRRFKLYMKPILAFENRYTASNYHPLIAAQKAVEAMEVQSEEGAILQKALAVHAWHERVIKLVDDTSRPLPRTLTRALKEGLAIPIDGEDFLLNELKRMEASASSWATRAKQVIGDHGQMPLVEVQALILEGEEMPVAFSKELSALRERSVLYCLCRKPYDEDRAMIACDRCGEWYHFSCINLPEPDSSDEDGEDAIQQECELSGDFVCPQCKDLVSERDPLGTSSTSPASSYRAQLSLQGNNMSRVVERTPFNGLVRGKRSNRSSNRARGELRHKWQSPLFAPV